MLGSNSSSNLASFFIVMIHNSSVNFKLIYFLLWIKGSYQSPSFKTLECSGKNLPNSSCHFPNHESVFLQILHDSSVSWKITLLFLFRSNVIYFAWKGPMKLQIFWTLKCLDQNSPNSFHFSNKKLSFFFKFCTTAQCNET